MVGPPLMLRITWCALLAFLGGIACWTAYEHFGHNVRYWQNHGGVALRHEVSVTGWVVLAVLAVVTITLVSVAWRRSVRVDAETVVQRSRLASSKKVPLGQVEQISVLATDGGNNARIVVRFDAISLTLLPGRRGVAKVRQIRAWARRAEVAFVLLPGGPEATWKLAHDLDQPLLGETTLPDKPPRRVAAKLLAVLLVLVTGGVRIWMQNRNGSSSEDPTGPHSSIDLPISAPDQEATPVGDRRHAEADAAFAALGDATTTIDCSRDTPTGPLHEVLFVRIGLSNEAFGDTFEAARRPGVTIGFLEPWAIGELVSSGGFDATSNAPIFGSSREMWVLTTDAAYHFDCSEFRGF